MRGAGEERGRGPSEEGRRVLKGIRRLKGKKDKCLGEGQERGLGTIERRSSEGLGVATDKGGGGSRRPNE